MLGPNDLPWAVTGNRCAIVEKPGKERTSAGLYLPDTAKERYYSGRLIDAGLQARNVLWDAGIDIGDEVEFGRYAGLREAWDHVVDWGTANPATPDDAYGWQFDKEGSNTAANRYVCKNTGAVRLIESVIVINVDDILGSHQLAERIRNGRARYRRGKTAEGETQFICERSE